MTDETRDADPGPIEPDLHRFMNVPARGLDETFNGEAEGSDRKIGFFLAAFPFENQGRFNYISNVDKLDVCDMLKDILARLETRISDEGSE